MPIVNPESDLFSIKTKVLVLLKRRLPPESQRLPMKNEDYPGNGSAFNFSTSAARLLILGVSLRFCFSKVETLRDCRSYRIFGVSRRGA